VAGRGGHDRCNFIASALEPQESLSHRLARLGNWQADELPLSLAVLAYSNAVFHLGPRCSVLRDLQSRCRLPAAPEAEVLRTDQQPARSALRHRGTDRCGGLDADGNFQAGPFPADGNGDWPPQNSTFFSPAAPAASRSA
jgi:hypothetical protein